MLLPYETNDILRLHSDQEFIIKDYFKHENPFISYSTKTMITSIKNLRACKLGANINTSLLEITFEDYNKHKRILPEYIGNDLIFFNNGDFLISNELCYKKITKLDNDQKTENIEIVTFDKETYNETLKMLSGKEVTKLLCNRILNTLATKKCDGDLTLFINQGNHTRAIALALKTYTETVGDLYDSFKNSIFFFDKIEYSKILTDKSCCKWFLNVIIKGSKEKVIVAIDNISDSLCNLYKRFFGRSIKNNTNSYMKESNSVLEKLEKKKISSQIKEEAEDGECVGILNKLSLEINRGENSNITKIRSKNNKKEFDMKILPFGLNLGDECAAYNIFQERNKNIPADCIENILDTVLARWNQKKTEYNGPDPIVNYMFSKVSNEIINNLDDGNLAEMLGDKFMHGNGIDNFKLSFLNFITDKGFGCIKSAFNGDPKDKVNFEPRKKFDGRIKSEPITVGKKGRLYFAGPSAHMVVNDGLGNKVLTNLFNKILPGFYTKYNAQQLNQMIENFRHEGEPLYELDGSMFEVRQHNSTAAKGIKKIANELINILENFNSSFYVLSFKEDYIPIVISATNNYYKSNNIIIKIIKGILSEKGIKHLPSFVDHLNLATHNKGKKKTKFILEANTLIGNKEFLNKNVYNCLTENYEEENLTNYNEFIFKGDLSLRSTETIQILEEARKYLNQSKIPVDLKVANELVAKIEIENCTFSGDTITTLMNTFNGWVYNNVLPNVALQFKKLAINRIDMEEFDRFLEVLNHYQADDVVFYEGVITGVIIGFSALTTDTNLDEEDLENLHHSQKPPIRFSKKKIFIHKKSMSCVFNKNKRDVINITTFTKVDKVIGDICKELVNQQGFSENIKVRSIQTGDDSLPFIDKDITEEEINEIFAHSYEIEAYEKNILFSANQKLKEKLKKKNGGLSKFVSRVINTEGDVYNLRDPECFLDKVGVCKTAKITDNKRIELIQLESLRALAGQLLTIKNTPFTLYDDIYSKGMQFIEIQHKTIYNSITEPWIVKEFSLSNILQQDLKYTYIDNTDYTIEFKKKISISLLDVISSEYSEKLYQLIIWFEVNKNNNNWLIR